MNESFVDLSYRGLSLGKRIKLTQVRPSSGYLELPSPMPVGTHVAVVTDDGVQFEATVAWIHEQVAGTDRSPGMVVIPELGADAAAAWWKAHVVLPDESSSDPRPRPRPRPRSRPVTVRPRSHTRPTAPPAGALANDIPAIKADLEARVAAAAGVEPPALAIEPPTTAGISSEHAIARLDDDDEPEMTVSTDEEPAPEPPPVLRRTGEHAVVDDGKPTMIMQSVDPEALGLEFPAGEVTDPGQPARSNGTDPGESMDDDGGPTDPGGGAGRDRGR